MTVPRYMTLETVAAICDTDPMGPAMIAALLPQPNQGRGAKLLQFPGRHLND